MAPTKRPVLPPTVTPLQRLVTQAEFEDVGLLGLYALLNQLDGWEWTVQLQRHHLALLSFEATFDRQPRSPIRPSHLLRALEEGGFEKVHCVGHDGSGLTSPACWEFTYLWYAT